MRNIQTFRHIYFIFLFLCVSSLFTQEIALPPPSPFQPDIFFTSKICSQFRANLSSDSFFDLQNIVTGTFSGNLSPNLFYTLTLGLSVDRINPEVFPPYSFTKHNDGFHIWFGEGKYSDGINDHLNIGFSIAPEITGRFFDDRLMIRWAKTRRNWGIGEGSLLLSESARPFDGIDIEADLTPGVEFKYVTGSLGNWKTKETEQKMLTAHKISFTPFPWLGFAFGEAVIWGKRLELSYLNPLMSYFLAQNISTGDMDNIAYIGDLRITPVPFFTWYFSFFIDEIETDRFSEFFKYVKNQYAYYTGVRMPLDTFVGLPLEALFQYTKLESYVYTHYPQQYPFFDADVKVNVNFTHDGENLGYPLPPNSDEFLLKLSGRPRKDLGLAAKYRHIRHGTGRHENGQIEGDINVWLDYGNLDKYPDKNFLNDGIYEYIHVLTLSGIWKPLDVPLELSAEYSFVHGTNFGNIPGNTVVKNLFGLGISYSF